MYVTSVFAYRFKLPLVTPVTMGSELMKEREGFLLKLVDEEGFAGWGEAAPLPGFSTESLESVEDDLRVVCHRLPGRSIDYAWRSTALMPLGPSCCFAVESGVVNLLSARNGVPPAHLLAREPAERVTLNALLQGTTEEICRIARHKSEQGYRIFKLKVGRDTLERDVDVVRELARCLEPGSRLRIDANRSWTWEEAGRFIEAIQGIPIEYLEEPLQDPGKLPELAATYSVPLAIDESTVGLSAADLHVLQFAHAVVLKPTLVGGIARTLEMATRALEMGMQPVLSAAYESGVGLSTLVALAAATGCEAPTAGIDTYDSLANDLLLVPLCLEGGTISSGLAAPAVSENYLMPVGVWTA